MSLPGSRNEFPDKELLTQSHRYTASESSSSPPPIPRLIHLSRMHLYAIRVFAWGGRVASSIRVVCVRYFCSAPGTPERRSVVRHLAPSTPRTGTFPPSPRVERLRCLLKANLAARMLNFNRFNVRLKSAQSTRFSRKAMFWASDRLHVS